MKGPQDDDFTVKTLCKKQIIEIAIKCELLRIGIYLKFGQDLSFYKGITSTRKFFTFSIVFIVFLLFSIVFKQ